MIRSSIAAFINASILGSAPFGVKAYSFQPDIVIGEYPKPVCFVSMLNEPKQDLWVVGDAKRKQNPVAVVTFYCVDAQSRTQIAAQFRRLIESAKTLDVGGIQHPGIDYIPTADLLRNEGDNKTYDSDQPGWFSSPTPIIYKNVDANGNPIVVSSGFSIDYANGKIVFAAPNSPSDVIRATYKAGVIDFIIGGVDFPMLEDIANNMHKFNAVFSLQTWYYVKENANKYL